MQPTSSRTWHGTAVIVAATSAVMAAVYAAVMQSQGDTPVPWVVAGLVVAAGLSAYAATPAAELGPSALGVAGCLLIVLGVLGILSIGLPILGAGIAATVSSRRRSSHA